MKFIESRFKVTNIEYFQTMTWVKDLVYYEGPLLSHMMNGEQSYLYKWVDNDSQYNRWLVIPVNLQDVDRVMRETLDFNTLLNVSSKIYIIDIDDNLKVKRVFDLPLEQINNCYIH